MRKKQTFKDIERGRETKSKAEEFKRRAEKAEKEREDLCKRIEALEQFMKGNRLLPNDSNTRKNITKRCLGDITDNTLTLM